MIVPSERPAAIEIPSPQFEVEDAALAQQKFIETLEDAVSRNDVPNINEVLSQRSCQPGPGIPSTMALDNKPLFKELMALAIEDGHPSIVSRVLGLGLKLSRLHIEMALDNPSAEIFQAFLDHGWDLNAPLSGIEPPVLAYVVRDEMLVRWFLSHGASPNIAPSRLARTPVMAAGVRGSLATMKLLFDHGALNQDVLQSAAESFAPNRLPVMQFLLDNSADIDAVKWKHHDLSFQTFNAAELGTALHYAAKMGHVDRVEWLLRKGADKDVLDSTGHTALQLAELYRQQKTMALLRSDSLSPAK